jgi:hypothetical protein
MLPTDFDVRRVEALRILASTGMWRSTYEPPLYRLVWRLGVEVPPPHFAPSRQVFGVTCGLFVVGMWLAKLVLGAPLSMTDVLWAGLLSATFLTVFYAIGRHCYSLPRWEQLSGVERSR